MIITPHPYGRMANRLILASHWIAHVEDTGDCYLHLCFADYARFFEGTKGKLFLRYQSSHYEPRRSSRTFGCVNIWNTCDKLRQDYDLNTTDFLERQAKTRYLLTIGWGFRDKPATERQRAVLVDFFKPVARHRSAIDRCIEPARRGVDHLVGVHIRQTDYRKFEGGKWFYPLSVYRRAMEDAQAKYAGSVRFLICADHVLDGTAFQGLDVVHGPGHGVEDCYALARCDFIIGPPSTYTYWASYYGGVPRFVLETADQPVDLSRSAARRL